MKKLYLMTPGPTPVPEAVMLEMAKPIIHHRTAQFQEIIKQVEEDLKYVFQTKNDVLIFASSGTGAMEAAVCNLLSAQDTVIVVRTGKFGERWTEICKAYGVKSVDIDIEWGYAADPKIIEDALKKEPNAKAVFVTLCETSTGAEINTKAIADITSKTKAVLVVDAISGLGACQLKTDEWGVDVVVSGSQKGLMIPPGLGFVSVSPKAWELVKQSKSPKYYFDFVASKKALDKTDTPYTPAITLIIGLAKALKMIKEETIEAVWSRHAKMAQATRAAVVAMGLELFAPTAPSAAVTPVKAPAGIDGEQIVKLLKSKYGIWVAGGQAQLKGKVFRIAHLGYMTATDILMTISALEMVLVELGVKIKQGAGIAAAQQELAKK
ncbi:MAG: aminotransferase [Candidatus Omnitrophica bacterium CG_4_8_14_3_um_filter_43_15]|nr:MAG: class V aminotransferase [Candidatus Omnitrophica bacterium CG1_02_43_210]PIR66119.1 MAG: aminotransferase [Candidatus Omnitrophica bacterium CG10_big_fil_rev_8_21_14_0_10_43_8]PIW80797.1 MAG: aminotransferase [Candidatus Omnitrophica bacterium CG_4_8_14_3_um_filter_43_15]PIY84737.1 MAG: aminotransferase [Candidatus Omnitrophica bacterium CG_4_10_14_0_8_um_filter_43_18]